MEGSNKIDSYRWVVVAAAFCAQAISFATFYSFGALLKPMALDFAWGRGIASSIFTIYMVVRGVSGVIMGGLTDRYGPRVTVAIGGALVASGLFLMSKVTAGWQVYLFYGVMVAIGGCTTYAPLAATVSRWFKEKQKGIALGILTAGMGVGGATIMPLMGRLVSAYGWRISYVIFSIIALFIFTAAALLLKERSEKASLFLPKGHKEFTTHASIRVDKNQTSEGIQAYSTFKAMRTWQFWFLFVAWLLWGVGLWMVFVHLPPYITDIGYSLVSATSVAGVMSLVSIGGMLVGGWFSELLGTRRTLVSCLVVQTATTFCFIISGSLRYFYIVAIIFGLSYGGIMPLWPAIAGDTFGVKSMGAIFGILLLGSTIGAGLGGAVGGYIFDLEGSYGYAFFIAGSCMLLTTITIVLMGICLKRELRPLRTS